MMRLVKYNNSAVKKYLYRRSFCVSSYNWKPFDTIKAKRYSSYEGHVRTSLNQRVKATNARLNQYVFQNCEKWLSTTALVRYIYPLTFFFT